ncbi:lipoprotein [Spiroplasma sp. DGKH1]|uniref:lipoprotein n=1 Tax=Spiroplasma sp. DGKH1 TaxID=3050074 RepID=UPI0034C6DAB4
MKKLLSLLAVVTLTTFTTTLLVSCDGTSFGGGGNKPNPPVPPEPEVHDIKYYLQLMNSYLNEIPDMQDGINTANKSDFPTEQDYEEFLAGLQIQIDDDIAKTQDSAYQIIKIYYNDSSKLTEFIDAINSVITAFNRMLNSSELDGKLTAAKELSDNVISFNDLLLTPQDINKLKSVINEILGFKVGSIYTKGELKHLTNELISMQNLPDIYNDSDIKPVTKQITIAEQELSLYQ